MATPIDAHRVGVWDLSSAAHTDYTTLRSEDFGIAGAPLPAGLRFLEVRVFVAAGGGTALLAYEAEPANDTWSVMCPAGAATVEPIAGVTTSDGTNITAVALKKAGAGDTGQVRAAFGRAG